MTENKQILTNTEDILRALGVGHTLLGHKLTLKAVDMVKTDPDLLLTLTKQCYPLIAKCCDCSSFSVERNIRTVAKRAYIRNQPLLQKIAGYPISQAPSAGEFIDILVTYLERNEVAK